MGVLHFGQADGGETTDCDSGIRQMQTFKKLPMQAPKINATIRIGNAGILFLFGIGYYF